MALCPCYTAKQERRRQKRRKPKQVIARTVRELCSRSGSMILHKCNPSSKLPDISFGKSTRAGSKAKSLRASYLDSRNLQMPSRLEMLAYSESSQRVLLANKHMVCDSCQSLGLHFAYFCYSPLIPEIGEGLSHYDMRTFRIH